MTIDEQLAQANIIADEKSSCWKHCITNDKSCKECQEEHKQLAEWLEELKSYRASVFSGEMTQAMLKEARNKAIDDFVEKVKEIYDFTILEEEQLNEIAEQLKAGGEND